MNDKICPVCKFFGRITYGNHSGIIFQDKQEVRIHLCYYHSVDFFKSGQTSFIAKYKDVFLGYELLSPQDVSQRKMNSFFGL